VENTLKEPNDNSSKSNKKPDAPSAKKVFDLEEMSAVLEMLRTNDVREFKFERGDYKLSLKRGVEEAREHYAPSASASNAHPANTAQILPLVRQEGPSEVNIAIVPQAPQASLPAAPKSKVKDIPSPMVGTFYRKPAVDADAYVDVGDVVKKGDVLCIVEAMKIMNEIESETSGRIVEVCLEDGQMVEYGEPLFRIEPLD